MIHIRKSSAPSEVQRKLHAAKNDPRWLRINQSDTRAMRQFFDDCAPKVELRAVLYEEQHGLCAYCMQRLSKESTTGAYKIEHWLPLSASKETVFEYRNLLGVCHGGEKAEHGLLHVNKGVLSCDTAKGSTVITLDPRNSEHIGQLSYKKDGFICAKDNRELDRDLNDVLQLNGKLGADGNLICDTYTNLVLGRRNAYATVSEQFERWDKKKVLTVAKLEEQIELIQRKIHSAEQLPEYIGVTLYRYQRKLRQLKK